MLFFPLSSKQTQQVFISPNNKKKIGTLENPGPGLWEILSSSRKLLAFIQRTMSFLGTLWLWCWVPEGDPRGSRIWAHYSIVLQGNDGRMQRDLEALLQDKMPCFLLWKWLWKKNITQRLYLFKQPIPETHCLGILSCEPPRLGPIFALGLIPA